MGKNSVRRIIHGAADASSQLVSLETVKHDLCENLGFGICHYNMLNNNVCCETITQQHLQQQQQQILHRE